MASSSKISLLLLVVVSVISSSFASVPFINNDESRDDMIFLFGKWFHKNGLPILPAQATQPQIFQQCFDHNNSSGCETKWNQRYWVREDYYAAGGPIFFQFGLTLSHMFFSSFGGEGPADALIDNYYWHAYAQEYNAMLVVLEHRFYGESWPSFNSSMEVLQTLTSQNALADAAYFIDEFTASEGLNGSDWVAFGGSYAGNLAAWMKQKYPNHVKTAVASSGPLLAVYDFPGYLETVSEVVKALDTVCYDKVYDAFNCMESLVNGSNCGNYSSVSEIIPALRQCSSVDFSDVLDRETFFNILAMGKWADNWPSAGITRNCAVLNRVSGSDPLSIYGNFLVEMGEGGNCKVKARSPAQETQEVLKFIRSKEGKQSGAAGWFWQTCYEFGYYMSADPKNGLFGYSTFSGWPYGISCQYEFGPSFTKEYTEERIAMTNEYYKGKEIDSKCVILVNGEWDPWHTLGINSASETSSDNTVVYVPKAEHCDDMLNPKTEDMRQAQALIQRQIGLYLNDSKC